MNRIFFTRSLPVLLLIVMPVRAEERTHDITVDDYFSIAVIATCAMSPDGSRVAYVEARWEAGAESRNSDLWVAPADGSRKPTRLTFDAAAESSPAWSPDGKYIYYAANYRRAGEKAAPYNGKSQVWRIRPDGGEPQAVTREADGVGWFELSRDGNALYYIVTEEAVAKEFKDLKSKYKTLEYGHGVDNFSQLWKLDLHSWRGEKLIDDRRVIRSAAVSPSGSRIAMFTTPSEPLLVNEGWSRLDIWNAETKKITSPPDKLWRADAPSPYGWLEGLAWSSDGKSLAFGMGFDGYPAEVFVAEWKEGDIRTRRLARPEGAFVRGDTLAWRGDTNDLCFLADLRAGRHLYCAMNVADGGQGKTLSLTEDDAVVGAFDFSDEGGRLAVVRSDTASPPEVYAGLCAIKEFTAQARGRFTALKPVTDANPQVRTWKLPQLSKVTWKAPDGAEVEGILELPPGYKSSDGPLPLIVELHGGPTDATPFCLIYWIYGRTLLPAKGYALLSPNYRGSTGYGDKFLTDLIGRENDIEVKDILAGVDAMVQQGIADPDKLGVMGWSNGGFLTNCLITQTTRFKAASSGAGVLDQFMQWGMEDTPGHVINYMKGYPWKAADAYLKGSPSVKLDKIKTPTLIHVGENDARVPAAHARTLYRALHHYLDVPAELVVYPGEGHGLMKQKHRKAKMEWDVAWFDRYVRGKSDSEKPKRNTD